jgi:hypothetical protein
MHLRVHELVMARDFDGARHRVPATVTAVDTGDWTMGAWINADSAGETSAGRVWCVTSGATDIQLVRVATNAAIATAQVFGTTNATTVTADNAYTLNVWTCVVATYRDSDKKCRVYLGTLATAMAEASYVGGGGAQTAGVGTRTTGGTNATIGNRAAEDRSFDGRLSRVFFTARELTLSEAERFRLGEWSVVYG